MKNELNPIIKAVAEQYKFEIKWCNVLNYWTIRHESHNCNFFGVVITRLKPFLYVYSITCLL